MCGGGWFSPAVLNIALRLIPTFLCSFPCVPETLGSFPIPQFTQVDVDEKLDGHVVE